jgi:hypothetical protein
VEVVLELRSRRTLRRMLVKSSESVNKNLVALRREAAVKS